MKSSMTCNTPKVLSALAVLVLTGFSARADMRSLAFHVAGYSKESPVVDGRMNDAAWKQADACAANYVYNQPNPEPGALKSELRLLWNEQGLFVSIANADANMAKIRTKCDMRDSPDLWQDDCAELYFDPSADSIGFTKFTVNALGTFGDMRRVDAAVTLNDWNASGVQVVTQREADSWNLEMFIPWSDLGKAPTIGSIWKFCHVRYSWSSGNFVGASSSPGGSNTSPGNFGYLYFAGSTKPDRSAIAAALAKVAAPPWSLPMDNGLLICENGQPVFEELSTLVAKEQAQLKIKFAELSKNIKAAENPELSKSFLAVQERMVSAPTTPATLQGLKSLKTLNAELADLNTRVELEQF